MACNSRTRLTKKRRYNPNFEKTYMMVEIPMGTMCLICEKILSDNRSSNVKRHYENYHTDFDKLYPMESQCRENEINRLKSKSRTINSLDGNSVTCINLDLEKTTAISYRVSHLMIKSGKPFSDGDLLKSVLCIFVDELFKESGEKSKIETALNNISLSRRTMVRRMETMNADLIEQLDNDVEKCIFFSLELDESNDMKETAQPNIFIKLVFKDFTVKEEFLDILSLKGATNGQDIYTLFKNCLIKHALPLEKLVAVTTDGAPAVPMLGENADFITLCRCDPDFPQFASFQCLIRQVSLASKVVKLDHVVPLVVKIANSIKARPSQNKLYQNLVEEESGETTVDLSSHCDARWLSLGKVLKRFMSLLPRIREFLDSKNEKYEELDNHGWLMDLNFLIDLTSELNALNSSLRGKNLQVWKQIGHIGSFKSKLTLWIESFRENEILVGSFPNLENYLKNFNERIDFSTTNFVFYLQRLLENLQTSFKDWRDVEVFADFLPNIFNVNKIDKRDFLKALHSLYPSLDMGKLTNELLYLPKDSNICSPSLGSICASDVFKCMKEADYPALISAYQRMLAIFGTTDSCELSSATMRSIKCRHRSKITDDHLGQVLRICTSSYKPDFEKLISNSQCHPGKN